ncbi:TlpA family protein disulfide reductase [Albibacterium indicum]|uniref:TlpA family protein disulfide reductase n=1 Tax=Albibacterium indicum TaxID=2292082 RepID=UPI000E551893|nr:TlpA disulfide reductase family protein [Pedobacter indicus]
MRILFVLTLYFCNVAAYAQKNDIPTQLTTVDGKVFSLKDLNDKVLVINYWFLACGPCILEIPNLKAVSNEFKGNEKLYFIAITPRDEAEQLIYFKKKKDFGYHLIAKNNVWPKAHDIAIYPTNIIIKNGKIVYRSTGYNKDIKEELVIQIKNALNN